MKPSAGFPGLCDRTRHVGRESRARRVRVDQRPAAREDLPTIEQGTFLTYRQESGGRTMTLPGHALAWAGAAGVPVPPEAVPAIQVPVVDHHLTWHRAVNPPWEAIRCCVGTVNDAAFMGAAAATVLFAGATAQREFIRIGDLADPALGWRIGYLFRERAIKTGAGGIVGWNHAYRSLPSDDPGWDELVDTAGNRPYPSSDFSQLFQFAATD